MAAIQQKTCPHLNFRAQVDVNRMEDTGRFLAEITIHCKECNLSFRFMGVPAGLSWDHPMASIDGLELRAPIEPENEPMLFSKARFEMPPELTKAKES